MLSTYAPQLLALYSISTEDAYGSLEVVSAAAKSCAEKKSRLSVFLSRPLPTSQFRIGRDPEEIPQGKSFPREVSQIGDYLRDMSPSTLEL